MTRKTFSVLVFATAVCAAAGSQAAAPPYRWDAASGLLPDQVSPPFTLVDTASPEDPVLAGGVLTLSGNLVAETMYYRVTGNDIGLPDRLQIDFRMHYVSGNRTTSVVAPAAVAFTQQGNVGNVLWIGKDEAFLWKGLNTIGARTTSIDTDGAFHDYRVLVDGKATGSAITVWQDGTPILSGATFANSDANSDLPRVAFGEFSIRAAGVSEWQSFSAAAPVPEPAAAWLLVGGLALLGGWRGVRRAEPAR